MNNQCVIYGVGAWGPGFNAWSELLALKNTAVDTTVVKTNTPKPAVIPANERRRAPLPVKMAVEVSWQALQASGLSSDQVACVFGSGLGDTDITDYMCRALTTELKQLSPTKFHNSVHNAAAGYWTISSECMQAANSIAAYQYTAALSVLEALTQCTLEQVPVMITLFDAAACPAYKSLFPVEQSFAAALLVCPAGYRLDAEALAIMSCTIQEASQQNETNNDPCPIAALAKVNPAAKIAPTLMGLGDIVAGKAQQLQYTLPLGGTQNLQLTLQALTDKNTSI